MNRKLRESSIGTIGAMVLYAFLGALAVSVVALVFAVVRAVTLWRHAKRTGRAFEAELASFDERTAHTERYLAEVEATSAELERALARLHASRAQLQVLTRALETAQDRVRWLRVFVPVR